MLMVLIKLVMLVPAAKLISTARNETKPTPLSYPGGLCPLIVSNIMGGFLRPLRINEEVWRSQVPKMNFSAR